MTHYFHYQLSSDCSQSLSVSQVKPCALESFTNIDPMPIIYNYCMEMCETMASVMTQLASHLPSNIKTASLQCLLQVS